MKFCLGVITARGGSKGLPRKNIRPFAGKPLIVHTIEAALACPLISDLMVTTDCPEIAEVARNAGARVPFLRPSHLAGDNSRQEDAILHLMDWVETHEQPFEHLMLLMPTSPLRRSETLSKGLETVKEDSSIEALYPVHRVDLNIHFCNTLRTDGFMKDWVTPERKWANRQELPTVFNLSGLYCLSRWEAFRRERSFLHDQTRSIVVDPIESIDINSAFDFFVAETLMKRGIQCQEDFERFVAGEASSLREK